MYKSAAKDINDYINDHYPKKDDFTYEETLLLVNNKIKNAKEKEADELFNMIQSGKQPNMLSKNDILRSLNSVGIDASDREVSELLEFANAHSNNKSENGVTRDDFRKFFIS